MFKFFIEFFVFGVVNNIYNVFWGDYIEFIDKIWVNKEIVMIWFSNLLIFILVIVLKLGNSLVDI